MSGQMRVIGDFSSQSRKPRGEASSTSTVTTTSIVQKKNPDVSNSAKLSDGWVLWSHNINDTNWNLSSYSQLCEVTKEDHVEWLSKNFPAVEDHIFYLMRKGIVPIWEDPRNRNGGCFSYKFSRKFYRDIWTDSCKALIFDYLINDIVLSETVTGISINPRTITLKIWNNNKLHNQQTYVNPCVRGVDFKSCMYKPHEIDETRIASTGFRGNNEVSDSSKSEEQKITIILQRITALMSKLVKTNLSEFSNKIKKMEELFSEDCIYRAFDRYQFVNPENDNEHMYIKLKLRLIYGLNCRNKIYKMIFDKLTSRYNEIIHTIKVDEDLTPKNISELEEQNATDEDINRNIFVTNIRNEVKYIIVSLYYYIHVGLLEDKSDFWTEIINNTLGTKELVNPCLVFDGIMRLIIMIKPKLQLDIVEKLQEYKVAAGNNSSRKIKFAIDDVCIFLKEGKKTSSVIELHSVFAE